MQDIKYKLPTGEIERVREFFEGTSTEDVWDKMRKRFNEIEKEHKVVSMNRTELSKNQLKRLRKKEKK